MYKAWYRKHLSTFDDSLATSHEVTALQIKRSGEAPEKIVLPDDQIHSWLQRAGEDYKIRALFTCYRKAESDKRECPAFQMSLTKTTFEAVSKAFHIPPSYLYLRVNANASGVFAKYCDRDEDGNITNIALIIRVPHAPQNEDKSIWSIVLSWDLRRMATDILFDGMTESDLPEFETYMRVGANDSPFAFIVFLIELLATYYTKMNQSLGADISKLESRLGITRGRVGFHGWNWKPDRFRTYTQECYRITASPVYLERRLVFLMSLNKFILECLNASTKEVPNGSVDKTKIIAAATSLTEALENHFHFAQGQLHQTRCLEKRLQNLMSTLNTIVAQVDSRSNLEVATAAKHDSSSMLTIAFLTALFLPPTYVSSIFGMNFFNFDDTARQGTISPLFWLYWVVTIPLTAAVIATWRFWEAWRQRAIRAEVHCSTSSEHLQV